MNSQLNEVISQIQKWTLLLMIIKEISRLSLKQYYTDPVEKSSEERFC